MATYLYFFLGLSLVSLYLLWVVMLQNGTLGDMFSAALGGNFENGKTLRTRYVGIPGIDTAIALLVAFFDPVTNGIDTGSRILVLDFLSTLQTVGSWLTVEALRKGNSSMNPTMVPVWGLLWNAMGAAVVLPIYAYLQLSKAPKSGFVIPLHNAKALLPSTIIAGIVPIFFLLRSTERDPEVHQLIVAVFQATPLMMFATHSVMAYYMKSIQSSSQEEVSSASYTKSMYVGTGLIAGVGHLYTQFIIFSSTDPALSYKRVYLPSPKSVYTASNDDRLVRGAHLFLQYDWIVVNVCLVVWVQVRLLPHLRGISIFKRLCCIMLQASGTVALGPGFTTSMGLWWQEKQFEVIDRADNKSR